MKNVILGTVNNHGQAAFEWNLAADQNCDPHTVGGCPDCKGAITINKKSNKVDSYNVSYYIIGQAAKFVRPGSVKISSKSSDDSLINAAFETKDGKIVLIVLNDGNKEVDFKVKFEDNTITSKLNAGKELIMSLGFWEIVLIVVVVLVLFGPKRIPELARAIGRANYEYKKAKNDIEAESKELIENSEKAAEAQDKKSETQA